MAVSQDENLVVITSICYADTVRKGDDMVSALIEVSVEKLTLLQAARYLGVSRMKMQELVRQGIVSHTINPLDRREKLIPRDELDDLRRQSGREPRES